MLFVSHCLGSSRCISCENPDIIEGKLTGGARLEVGAILADVLLSLTALVVGILGLTGTIRGMPPAASYALIGLSGTITLAWIIAGLQTKGTIFSYAKGALQAAISSTPIWPDSP